MEQFNQELELVFIKIKKRKATGLDKIPSEVWKTRKHILLGFCNAVYNQNAID